MDGSFYLPEGDLLISTEATRGPWSPDHQHGGPPSALLTRAIEMLEGGDGKRVAQIGIALLRPIPIAPLAITASVVRPGKNVDLCRATISGDGKDLMIAHGWRYRKAQVDLDIDHSSSPPRPVSEGIEKEFFPTEQDVGYHTAMEWLFIRGAFREPGDARVWMRMRIPLLPGEVPSGAQKVLCAVDSASGVSARLHTGKHLFVNTDLTVALHREHIGDWVHLDASTALSDQGAGTTTAIISDEQGSVGSSLQSLFVAVR